MIYQAPPKAAVSRHYLALTHTALAEPMARPLNDLRPLLVMIDGEHVDTGSARDEPPFVAKPVALELGGQAPVLAHPVRFELVTGTRAFKNALVPATSRSTPVPAA